ncbi:MAG: glycosyltransferase family 2 protein [Candidatus Omnitrophota bacterium]|jgi:GT2 family glycosyltransferase
MQCDIIIPVWNQLAFTKDCIDSIARNTDAGYRIIVVDNASNDETRHYLDELKAAGRIPIMIERNDVNTGFIKAANKGMAVSKAPYVCILNNDTLVTKGWLKEMIGVAGSSKDIGIVNPSSNNLGQKPGKGEPVELYAERLCSSCAGLSVELGAAIGFCMLIKREVIDRIGFFDEVYGMGNFEDTDYSRRAVKEGYRCVRACSAYVYHRENSSFRLLKTFDEDFRRNKEIFEFRWGRPRRVAYVLDSSDALLLKRLAGESVRLARDGNWIWYFFTDSSDIPQHSNIIPVPLLQKNFYLKTAFRILKKKKKFDEIFVSGGWFGRILEKLSFIHRAKINYY